MSKLKPRPLRVAVDVGGTFTDVVVHDGATGRLHFDKVPTTPAEPSQGVFGALTRIGADPSRIGFFAHGTTLGVNALLTRTGARIGIVTTEGFKDVYLLGRTDRSVNYDFKYRKPRSLVPREFIFEVPERIDFHGEILAQLDSVVASMMARRIRGLGLESVAVCLLHAYINPAHELAIKDIFADVAPDVEVTLSHELTREYHEYERTSTTVLDAYIKPLVRNYIGRLEAQLAADGFRGRFFMVRSGGGAMTASRAKEAPVNLILSGPAGGVIGAAAIGAAMDEHNLIAIDMGGTSMDASLVIDGKPVVHHEASIDGLPFTVPSLYIKTIGAGGGSLVWLDEAGHLQVGPSSAGADPGPAAYGRGGTEPTVTDAALICGYLGSDTPLVGTLRLEEDHARRALVPLSEALGMTVEHVADGVLRIVVTKIVGAIRAITIELGHHPRDFALLAFGGAGGLVAADVARELGVRKVIIPPGPGSFSALGMLMADVQCDASQTFICRLAESDPAVVEDRFAAMELEVTASLRSDGFRPTQQQVVRFADLRYYGQEHTVTVEAGSHIDGAEVAHLGLVFAEGHRDRYGHVLMDPVELVTIRVRGIGAVERLQLPELKRTNSEVLAALGERMAVHGGELPRAYSLYKREAASAGDGIEGPAIITEYTGTTVLHQGDVARFGPLGEIRVVVREAGECE